MYKNPPCHEHVQKPPILKVVHTLYFWTVTEHKIVIVGLDNAGKTTILYQFLMNEVVTTSPTIGSNVEEVVWKNIHFIMWDLGGQQSLRAAWSTYYSNTEVSSVPSNFNFLMILLNSKLKLALGT